MDFLLTMYPIGNVLTEILSLEAIDIDNERKLIYIRRNKGHKDRLIFLPKRTLGTLYTLGKIPSRIKFFECERFYKYYSESDCTYECWGHQNAVKMVVRECSIKKVFLHVLFPLFSNTVWACARFRNFWNISALSSKPSLSV